MLNGFVYLIFATMLTILISVIAPGNKAVDMIANVISLGMSFVCGVFVPQSLLSGTVLNIGKFLPAYWYVRANNMLAGSSGEIFGMGKYMTCIGIELAFSIAMFCVTLLVAKTKRSSKSV
jgi:ABC-2 type transport system permease protein